MKIPFHPPRRELDQPATGAGLEQIFSKAADFLHIDLTLPGNRPAKIYWLLGMVRTERLNDYVVRPLVTIDPKTDPVKWIGQGGVWTLVLPPPKDLEEACTALCDGCAALEVGKKLFLIPVPTEDKRSIQAPEDEPDQKGAKDSFVESLRNNTSLVRRRMHTWRLCIRTVVVGRESQTKVDVVWVEGITDPKLVKGTLARVRRMDVDALLDTQPLTDALTDNQRTPFPLCQITQRPDRFCLGLMEGRVGVFCDGIAQGWLVPGNIAPCFRTPQNKSNQWMVVWVLMAVRFLCVGISLLLPAGYIAVASFHFGMMPAAMAETISAARQNVPIPPPLEVVGLLLAFEILQEAGVKMPQLNGQSVSVIGSVVVGQAAVQAKLLSPVVVVVVAAAGIASYTLPDQDMANALRAVRLILAVLAGLFGMVGIVLGIGWLCCHLSRLSPLGVPWLAPFAPDVPKAPGDMTRTPPSLAKFRDLALHPLDWRNQK